MMADTSPTVPPNSNSSAYERSVHAWAMYDWANSAYAVTILTAVFPVYYRSLVINAGGSPEKATAFWAYTTSLSLIAVALVGPLLGAIVDVIGRKKRFLGCALAFGVLGSLSLAFLGQQTFILASVLFAVSNFGFAGGNIFYESLLPQIARADDLDRVSARGYALGYLGGGFLLVINALWLFRPVWFAMPDRDFAVRACFVSVALWWLVFALPLFRHVRESTVARPHTSVRLFVVGARRLVATFQEIRRYRQLVLFLLAFWLYNDAISTIIKLAAAYGDEIGIGHNDMLIALILTQFIGFPCSIGFGRLAHYFSAKLVILGGLAVYAVISISGFFIHSAGNFYALAIAVGLVQGGTQGLSRSLFASMVPQTRSAEFFGFFSTGEKFAGIIGPTVFGVVGQLAGSSRWGIVSLIFLFAAGALLLRQVDQAEGRRLAQTIDASV